MHSPLKSNAKKTRKSTFNQAIVAQTDVGEFENGRFKMPDPVSTKENHCSPLKHNKNIQHKQTERSSPSRRKSLGPDASSFEQSGNSPSSPSCKERSKTDIQQDFKRKHTLATENNKDFDKTENTILLRPGSFAVPIPFYCPDSPSKLSDPQYSSSKDCLSTSPFALGRWAGPAFGNAPHPSTLPIPEFFSSMPLLGGFSTSTPPKHVPPAHDMSSSSHLSSIPVVPFPYVASHVPAPAPVSILSAAQLSTDLRRLLNIDGAVPVEAIDHSILVSASSS